MTEVKSIRSAVTVIGLSVASLLAAFPLSEAQERLASSSPRTVTGQVSAVEGQFHMTKDPRGGDILKFIDKAYIITTPTGQEIQLTLTQQTRVPARANPGDRVEAKISKQGQTLSVKLIEP
jgi:hypothetical protein